MDPRDLSHHWYCDRLTSLAASQFALRQWIAYRQERGWPVPKHTMDRLADLGKARVILVREVDTLEDS